MLPRAPERDNIFTKRFKRKSHDLGISVFSVNVSLISSGHQTDPKSGLK